MSNHFGETLREMRTGAGITIQKLAGLLECSLSYISDIELGKRSPMKIERIHFAAQICDGDFRKLLVAATKDLLDTPIFRAAIEEEIIVVDENPSPGFADDGEIGSLLRSLDGGEAAAAVAEFCRKWSE